MDFTPEQISKLTAIIGRDLAAWLSDRTVEPHYSAERAAELLEVSQRTIWNYVYQYDTTGGREGLGPVVKLSHKAVRIPASALNRFLRSRTISAAQPSEVAS